MIALVITIVILLILAGIAIGTLGGKNGLIAKVNKAKKAQIEAEMKEKLTLAITELQTENEGKATLDDVTQEWVNNNLTDYDSTIATDASINEKKITMSKSGIIGKYIIDENLNITEVKGNSSSIEFSYDVKERIENKVKILIHVQDKENGLSIIEFPNVDAIIVENNKKEEKEIDYEVEIGTEYKIKITSENGQTQEETILVTDYWYNITKNLEEGIELDNPAIKAAYNKPYKATITEMDGYIIEDLEVKMNGESIELEEDTGIINIEKVIGNIEINITTTKITPLNGCLVDFWSFNNSLESSIENNNQREKFTIYKGNNLEFEDEGIHLESTVIATENNYLLPNEFSVVFKYKPTKINTWGLILGKVTHYANINTYNGIFIRTNMDEGKLCNGISDVVYKVDNILTIGMYSTLALTYNGTDCRLYRNGELITQLKGYNDLNSKMFIGGSIYSGTGEAGVNWGYEDGYFKDLAIYNRCLTRTELRNFN